ncbi:phosphoadenylyl-sulfate reductase [Thalassotalea sp. ND16A]|uniref:phosphoadenylyl-sulfate reductase n=1 Tax=Thalassotalea sp. ND16A TaxID=1535422 RepID=UPI00051A198A|nr:phosphoadenylyl-sulfate reductase [Thalassotalea sp. ND16A]KGJ88426.1 Phosphoadenylyl-sulfate reductase (thioredoxin) [Thalassotalea sp. ND16A]
MANLAVNKRFPATLPESLLQSWNEQLEKMTAIERLEWAFSHLPDNFALTSSFGIQSAVMLHMTTQIKPDIPVVLTDTGYLFAETYRFIDELTERLNLNLQVFRADISPAWQRARHGKQWAQGDSDLKQYNVANKVEPLERGLDELQSNTWFSGVRRSQTDHRKSLPVLQVIRGRFKFHPIIDWTNKDVHQYLTKHNLPYHPLWDEGYVSVGDKHSSQPLTLGMDEQDTRFNGMQRECGLHTDGDGI